VRRILTVWLGAAMGALGASSAIAGVALGVSPITVEFTPAGGALAVEVSNSGDAPTQVQVRLFEWQVDRDGDHYRPTDAMLLSPPMFVLEPGAKQVVRLAAAAKNTGGGERAYRLFVDQIPGEPQPGRLLMPVRMVLPVFTAPAANVGERPALRWRLEYDRTRREAVVIAANDGRSRVKIVDLAYEKDGRRHDIQSGLAGYVLSGQERGWRFAVPAALTGLDLIAASDLGPVRVPLTFSPD
jgi:fimbrial chaperone protein